MYQEFAEALDPTRGSRNKLQLDQTKMTNPAGLPGGEKLPRTKGRNALKEKTIDPVKTSWEKYVKEGR